MNFRFSPHIAVQVSDYEQAIDFYTTVLGMKLISRGQQESELQLGEVTFHVEDAATRRVFLEFKVDDVEAARQALVDGGCKTVATRIPEGATSYLISDPYGLHFHIWQDKPADQAENLDTSKGQ